MDYTEYKEGVSASNFWFCGKRDLINRLLATHVGFGRNVKILNIGSGTGEDLEVIARYGKIYVIDISQEAISVVPEKLCVEKRVADACNLPYKDEFFDYVISFDVFEHIEDDVKSVSEVHRVLKKSGMLIFTVPAFKVLFSSHDKHLGHYRRYSKGMLRRLLHNFYGLRMNYWNAFMFPPIALLRLMKKNSKPELDYIRIPALVNSLGYNLLKFENSIIEKNIPLPMGLSIVGYCRK